MSEPTIFHLPRFQAALDRESATKLGLETDTHQRYKRGKLPRALIRFLIRRPDIAHALCADIQEAASANPGSVTVPSSN